MPTADSRPGRTCALSPFPEQRGPLHEAAPSDELPARTGNREPRYEAGRVQAGLYVHVPVCRSKCRYCGFYSVPVAGQDTGRLVAAMLRELDGYEGERFCTAYIGGGSPTALPAEQLVGLARRIGGRVADGGEFTVECNPGQVDADLPAGLREAGVNRLSFGAQSFRASELELLGRGHSARDITRGVELARRAGFENVGLDLIFAIPGSTPADWQYSVEAAIGLGVQHVSAYSLSFEEGTVFDAWREAGRLAAVDEELDRAMYDWAVERLTRAGLEQYEISNFARPGCECRHNIGYWRNRPFVGIGPGAASCRMWSDRDEMRGPSDKTSRTTAAIEPCVGSSALARHAVMDRLKVGARTEERGASPAPCVAEPVRDDSSGRAFPLVADVCAGTSDARSDGGQPGRPSGSPDSTADADDVCELGYACRRGVRVVNEPDVERYLAAVESGWTPPREVHPLGAKDVLCETAVLNLRMRRGIDLAEFRRRTGLDALRVFADPIRKHRELGLIELTDRAVRLTPDALPVADTVLRDFADLD